MWGYQLHFQILLQRKAENLFNRIDKNLQPNVFLLGILIDQREDRHKICLEPENCGYGVDLFSNIEKLTEELEKVDKESKIMHSHPIAQENHKNRIRSRAWIGAIKMILESEDIYGDTEKYISFPRCIEGFLVFTVLELNNSALNEHYSLTKEKCLGRFKISRSFIESTVDNYLNECYKALNDPNQGYKTIRHVEEILRESGEVFMNTISQAGDNFGLNDLYNTCNIIASMKYEGTEGIGRLAICNKEHINIRLTFELEEPIELSDYRKVRKFLELSSECSIIISDSVHIYGLGKIVGKYNPKDESLFIISFKSHFKWEVLHDNNSMMVVEYSLPTIRKDKINRKKFCSDLPRIFKDVENEQIDGLWKIITNASDQKHGTMVVISDNAEKESKRLGKQCFAIKPVKLQPNIIQQITSIDGAILLDRNSTCFAIGVILDGDATEKGDSSRGSRYNSAIGYYEQFRKTTPLLIVTISEDGMTNLIPNLRPQINRSDITDRIEELRELNKTGALSHFVWCG